MSSEQKSIILAEQKTFVASKISPKDLALLGDSSWRLAQQNYAETHNAIPAARLTLGDAQQRYAQSHGAVPQPYSDIGLEQHRFALRGESTNGTPENEATRVSYTEYTDPDGGLVGCMSYPTGLPVFVTGDRLTLLNRIAGSDKPMQFDALVGALHLDGDTARQQIELLKTTLNPTGKLPVILETKLETSRGTVSAFALNKNINIVGLPRKSARER